MQHEDIEQMVNKEIELTNLFYSIIKDTADELKEYFKLSKYSESEKHICIQAFIYRLKQSLKPEEKK